MAVKSRTVDWSSIPDVSDVWPSCVAQLSIEAIDEKDTSTGKSMMVVTFKGIEPKEIAGLMKDENFVIGTEDDPQALGDAWGAKASFGCRLFKKMLAAAGVPFQSADVAHTCATAIGQQLLATVKHEVEPAKNRDGTDNQYAGRVRDRLSGFNRLGARAPELIPCGCPQCTGQPAEAVVPPPTAAPPTTPPPSAPPSSPPKAKGKAEGKAAPAPPTTPPAAPAPPPPPQAPGGGMRACPLGCGWTGAVTELAGHVAQCAAQQTASATAGFKQE